MFLSHLRGRPNLIAACTGDSGTKDRRANQQSEEQPFADALTPGRCHIEQSKHIENGLNKAVCRAEQSVVKKVPGQNQFG
jgi:hypothetical protein